MMAACPRAMFLFLLGCFMARRILIAELKYRMMNSGQNSSSPKKKICQEKGTMMKAYLVFYNAASAAGWAYVLYLAIQCYRAAMVTCQMFAFEIKL
jgi:hypothetical protein